MLGRLAAAYRRTGADLPLAGSDPRPTHGAEMEGWFWRFTDAASGRAVVALCGVNRHPAGDWATVAVALHPGDVVRSAEVDQGWAADDRFEVGAGDVLHFDGTTGRLSLAIDDCELDVVIEDGFDWPLRLGGGGVFSAVPFLKQYWHPHLLGGRASGSVRLGRESWQLDGANVYAEKNWGKGFPLRWWWGQAQAFDRPEVCVAFSGGVVGLGPVAATLGGVVARVDEQVLRWTPPLALVRSSADGRRWLVRARGPAGRVELVGDSLGLPPHVLPVPLPKERRNVDTDFEHQAGMLACRIERRGAVLFEGTSRLAALEVGSLPGAEDAGRRRGAPGVKVRGPADTSTTR